MARDGNPLVVGGVIGDVLNPFTSTVSLSVVINNREINNGCEVRPSQVVNRPRAAIGGEDLRVFYTLVMVDADAPSPSNPFLREYLHWMLTDIPATTNATFGKNGVELHRELNFYELYERLHRSKGKPDEFFTQEQTRIGESSDPVVGRVTGDVLDPFEILFAQKSVSYGNGDVTNGCELKPSRVASQPRVSIGGDDLRNFYTLVLVDPDASRPRNPNCREYLQWEVGVTDILAAIGTGFGDVLNPFTSTVSLSVVINNREINNGCEVRPSQVVNRPRAAIGGEDLRVFYTLVIVDADAPSPSNPFLREYLHWMVTDIPATTNAIFDNQNFQVVFTRCMHQH